MKQKKGFFKFQTAIRENKNEDVVEYGFIPCEKGIQIIDCFGNILRTGSEVNNV